MRDHLQAVARNTGRIPEALRQEPVPAPAAALWDAFVSLSGAAGAGMGGPAPISFGDLAAWQQISGVCLSPWEADTLIDLDRAARAAMSKDTK